MAYNTKYILNYCNKERIPLRIELQVKDYVGEAFIIVNEDDYVLDNDGRYVVANIDGTYNPERDKLPVEGASNPFSLTYLNDSGEKNGTIRATSARMEFFEDINFNIDDLATSDETEIRCAFYFNNELEWIGFVVPDFFNVEITESPIIDLTASDRIGILKDVDYPIADFYTDSKVSLLSIFLKCIQETGLELSTNVVCSLYCDQISNSTISPDFDPHEFTNYLNDTYVSELAFVKDFDKEETLDCYTVLKRILDQANCLLTQYKGEWWVVNKADLENGQGVRIKYDSEGVFESISRFSNDEVIFNHIDTGGQRTIIPAGAVNTYRLDLTNYLKYPKNNSLIKGLFSVPYAWTFNFPGPYTPFYYNSLIPVEYNGSGVSTVHYEDDRPKVRTDLRIVSNPNAGINTIDVPWNNFNMESNRFRIGSVNSKAFDVDLSIRATGRYRTGPLIRFCLYFPEDDLVFVSNHLDNNQSYYVYKYSELIVSSTAYPLSFFEFENKYNDANLAVTTEFKINKTTSITYLQKLASQNGRLLTSNSFEKALMFVRFYGGFSRDSGIQVDMTVHEITVEFKIDNQTPTGTIYQSRIDGKFTKKNDQVDLIFGDFQEVGQNGFFYKYREDSLSITYNSIGARLKDWWTPYDVERNPQIVHAIRQQTRAYGRAHDELAIGFDLNRINPFAHYAVKCFSDYYVTNEENEYLTNDRDKYITASIGKYLNNKRFVFVEGTIDYLRSHFSGKLAQIRTEDVDSVEYIYSDFGNN